MAYLMCFMRQRKSEFIFPRHERNIRIRFCISKKKTKTVNKFKDVDGTVKFNNLLPIVYTENVLCDRFPIF